MEIKELISFYINESTHTLEVTFRLLSDTEDVIRNDEIEIDEVSDMDYDFIISQLYDVVLKNYEDFDVFSDYDVNGETTDDEIISFLNEYYVLYPNRLPKPELF